MSRGSTSSSSRHRLPLEPRFVYAAARDRSMHRLGRMMGLGRVDAQQTDDVGLLPTRTSIVSPSNLHDEADLDCAPRSERPNHHTPSEAAARITTTGPGATIAPTVAEGGTRPHYGPDSWFKNRPAARTRRGAWASAVRGETHDAHLTRGQWMEQGARIAGVADVSA